MSADLLSTAHRRLQCFNALVKLADDQKSMLMEGRHSELPDNLSKFDPLLVEIKKLETQEETLLKQMGAPGPEYLAIKARIAESVDLLKRISTTNKVMLARQMEYVSFSLGLIVKVATEHSIIGPGANPALMLDSRV